MSADKRKKILIVFGGLAVVLVAVIFIVSPSFKSDDAIGAIGAVQKHRAPQIAKSDVILGDEQLRQTQKVAYTDFLNDAAALQNLSRDFSAASKSNDSKARYEAMSVNVRARQQEVLARAQTEMIASLNVMRQLAETDFASLGSKKAAMIAKIDSLGAKAQSISVANVTEVESLAAKLKDVENALGMHKQEFVDKIAQKTQLTRRNKQLIDSFKSDVESQNVAAAQAALRQFDALTKQAELGQTLRNEVVYAEAMTREAAKLAEIDAGLNSADRERLGLLVVIPNDAARDLEARAASNMRENMDRATAEYESMSNFAAATEAFSRDQNFSRDFARLEARRADYAHRIQAESLAQVNAISGHLANANALGVRADESLGTQMRAIEKLGTQAQYASMLKGVSTLDATFLKGISNLDSNIKQGSMARQNMSLDATKK